MPHTHAPNTTHTARTHTSHNLQTRLHSRTRASPGTGPHGWPTLFLAPPSSHPPAQHPGRRAPAPQRGGQGRERGPPIGAGGAHGRAGPGGGAAPPGRAEGALFGGSWGEPSLGAGALEACCAAGAIPTAPFSTLATSRLGGLQALEHEGGAPDPVVAAIAGALPRSAVDEGERRGRVWGHLRFRSWLQRSGRARARSPAHRGALPTVCGPRLVLQASQPAASWRSALKSSQGERWPTACSPHSPPPPLRLMFRASDCRSPRLRPQAARQAVVEADGAFPTSSRHHTPASPNPMPSVTQQLSYFPPNSGGGPLAYAVAALAARLKTSSGSGDDASKVDLGIAQASTAPFRRGRSCPAFVAVLPRVCLLRPGCALSTVKCCGKGGLICHPLANHVSALPASWPPPPRIGAG
jgi:hypothetical protein